MNEVVEIQCCVNSTKCRTFEKYYPREQGTFWGSNFYPEFYWDPGSHGGNKPSTSPKSLVPGERSSGGNGLYVQYLPWIRLK